MSIYLVNADRLHFSAKQLEAMTRLHNCGDLGGIIEGVAWVRDNDDDIIILATGRRDDGHYMLLPRCHHMQHLIEFSRVAEGVDVIGWKEIATPSKAHVHVNVGRFGDALLLWHDDNLMNQKSINVNDGKLNISYKEGEENERT